MDNKQNFDQNEKATNGKLLLIIAIVLVVIVTVIVAASLLLKHPESEQPAEEVASAEEMADEEQKGGVQVLDTVDLSDKNEVPNEPLGEAVQSLEDQYTEHYNAVLAGVTSYAEKMSESNEAMMQAISEVLTYFTTDDVKNHITALSDIVDEMKAKATSETEKNKASGDEAALAIYQEIAEAAQNWDNVEEEKQQTVMAYIMALSMSNMQAGAAE